LRGEGSEVIEVSEYDKKYGEHLNAIPGARMTMQVSIITVCFNEEKTISDTCESVICQTFKDFEWIVVDGGSTDGTLEVFKTYAKHISHFVSEKDRGIYDAMNKGILKATGSYLLFLNGGDTLHDPHVLHDIFTDHSPKADILYGKELQIKKDGTWRLFGNSYKFDVNFWILGYKLRHQAAFFRRNLFEKYGLYNLEYQSAGDYELFLRYIFGNQCSVQYFDRVIDNYRFYDGLSSLHAHIGDKEVRLIQKGYFSRFIRCYFFCRRSILRRVASLIPFRDGRHFIRSLYKGEVPPSWNALQKT
jgi:glycosyltransferase involved in cell wall biosynthesis